MYESHLETGGVDDEISARLQITPAADRRGWTRRSLSLGSSLQATGEDVTIHDVSPTGLLIETSAKLAVSDNLEIELPEAGFTPALVAWSSGRFYGCQFKKRVPQAVISAAQLRSAPTQAPYSEAFHEPVREPIATESNEAEDNPEGKASLTVRMRVIFGSAVLLWAIIIWAASSLYHLIR